MKRFLPWIILGVFLIHVAAAMPRPRRSSEGFDLSEFGCLPVLMNGRVQPIDSVARLGLLQIRNAVTVPQERPPRMLDATEWLLEVLTKPDLADTRKIFLVDEPPLVAALGLEAGPTYYAFKALEPKLGEIGKQTARISRIKATSRAAWEQECLKLRNALVIYERLKNSLQPNSFLQHEAEGKPIDYDLGALVAQYQVDLRSGVAAAVAREHGRKQELDTATEQRMREFARPFLSVSRVGLLSIIPPADPARARDRWQNIGTILVDSARTGQLPAPVAHFAAMSSAFAQGKPMEFNGEVAKYRQWLTAKGLEPEASKARSEFFNNRFQPFVRATGIYLVATILACASLRKRSTVLYRTAAALVILAWVVHTVGLLFDMMLEGRPPMTNVYSSIIFAGWGVVLLGVGVERLWRNGIGMVTAALAGLTTLIVAHSLAPGGGVELMRAALNISFWFATIALIIALRLGRDAGTRPAPSVTEPIAGPMRRIESKPT